MTDSHPLKCKTNIYNFVINVKLYNPAMYEAALKAVSGLGPQKTYVGVTESMVSDSGFLQLAFNISLFNAELGVD